MIIWLLLVCSRRGITAAEGHYRPALFTFPLILPVVTAADFVRQSEPKEKHACKTNKCVITMIILKYNDDLKANN